jgi:hypothetical protein
MKPKSPPRLHAIIGRSPEQAAIGAACITALTDMFRPIVRQAIAPAVEEALKRPTTREMVDFEIASVITAQNDRPVVEYLIKPAVVIYLFGLRLWVGERGRVLRPGPKGRKLILDDTAEAVTRQMVRDWLSLLAEVAEDSGLMIVTPSELDDRMLPRSVFIENAFSDVTGLDPDRAIVLDVLGKVRRDLPDGRKLPEPAERFLKIERYEIGN